MILSLYATVVNYYKPLLIVNYLHVGFKSLKAPQKTQNVEDQPVLVPNLSTLPNDRERDTETPGNRGVSNNFNHTVSLPTRYSNAHGGRKNTPAHIDTHCVHRCEVENK